MVSHKSNTKELIISAAKKLFAEKGFVTTSMSEISEMVGIEKPSLYYFFKSKEALFAAVSEHNWSSLANELRSDPRLNQLDKVTREEFAQFIIKIIKNNAESGRSILDFKACVIECPALFKKTMQHRHFMQKKLRQFLEFQRIPNVTLAANLITSAILGYALQSQIHKSSASPEAFGKYLTSVIFASSDIFAGVT